MLRKDSGLFVLEQPMQQSQQMQQAVEKILEVTRKAWDIESAAKPSPF
jgi:hypothetical protein